VQMCGVSNKGFEYHGSWVQQLMSISVTVLLLIGSSGDGTLGTAISSEVVAMGMALVIVIGVMVAVVVVVLAGAAASMGAVELPLLCVLSGL